MRPYPNRFNSLKIILANWTIFGVLIVLGIMWLLRQAYLKEISNHKETKVKLDFCLANWENVEKQIGSGRIILELKK